MPIRIAIVEDDLEVREGLTWLFHHAADFACIAACATGEDAVRELPKVQPDVVLLDIHLPGKSGLECIPELKQACPRVQISMLTVIDDDESIFRALRAGATGYLLKKTPPTGIMEAARELHAGGSPMSSQIARKLVDVFAKQSGSPRPTPAAGDGGSGAPASGVSDLCARERQILNLLAQGHRYKEIADELDITIHTVRTFIRRMYEKLHVHSRTEALLKVGGR
jgi:DNA-binding NarL/FixJ family response regulator